MYRIEYVEGTSRPWYVVKGDRILGWFVSERHAQAYLEILGQWR